MKTHVWPGFNRLMSAALCVATALLAAPSADAGLTLELHLYSDYQGLNFAFYTPLLTNAIAPAAPLGTYIIRSPQWPTNGSQRGFDLTASGLADRYDLDSEYGYGDFGSALFQITNGTWSILLTNATTTNDYAFTVSAPDADSNSLPATLITFPADGSVVAGSQTNFTWQGPFGWTVGASAQVYDGDFYQSTNLAPAQTNWNVGSPLPVGANYTFSLQYLTTNSFFSIATPLNTNNAQPLAGWAAISILESGSSVSFDATSGFASPGSGHTCFAYYTFEDNSLFAEDFSGNNNNLSYAWFGEPPVIVTNDAAAGTYAGGFGGSGWFTTPDTLSNLFAGSFSVSLWLKTTNTFGSDTADEYSAAGIVSALGNDYGTGVLPMGQAGGKLVFYTGGSLLNRLYSQASINSGQYVHVVSTRDQLTGEKRIYIDGVLDSSVYSDTDMLGGSTSSGPSIGYNNGNVFSGEMDEIQFYSGVLSSNEVAFLHSHPGTNVADTLELSAPVARYDFEDPTSPGADSSGHHHDADCSSGGSPEDIASTNAAVGVYAREFFGATSLCFTPGGAEFPSLSNALTGSFSVTAWVNTTNSVNSDFANAYFGLPILFLYNSDTNSTIPLSITGHKAAFTIYDENGNAVTLHSTSTVNDGTYHFLAVTRELASGQMSLYVDGNLQATGTSSKQFLQIPWIHLAGGYYVPYAGLLDDVRIYAGVLTANDVAALAATGAPTFNNALGTAGLAWSTGGDSNWSIETTNTYHAAAAAAQSGSVTNSQSTTLSATVTGPGKLDFYWSSIANDPNQGFDYEFYIDAPGTNDIADLYGDNPWQSIQQSVGGPVNIPAGQHTLNWVVYANGDTDPTQAGFLDQVTYAPTDTNAVSADILLDVYRQQDPTFGDSVIAFPSFVSVAPAPTGTTTNYLQSPSGWFNTHTAPNDTGSGSAIVGSLAQFLQECTNGLWTLYINRGTLAERQFQFSVAINGLTTNLMPAVRIVTPTNNAAGVPADTSFQWAGPANYSALTVSKQNIDGSDFVSATLSVGATDWPSPPDLDVGTNQFDIAYTSNNFPTVTFSVPVDVADSQTVSNWAAAVNLHTTARSIFLVTAGAAPVQLLNAGQRGTSFQFQFQSQAGFTNAVQYRTNLISGLNWQTCSNIISDGTLKTVTIPFAIFGPARQGFVRVTTQ
ncbi:MAG: LamG domain-containing protein [Verrucomicrobiota bacterium]|jgi:hypothetical protein